MKEIGLSMSDIDPPRPRRSTLETFNEEMAVLDRPLDGEVEYYDEAPVRPSAWRRVGMFVAVAAIIGVGGSVVMSRHRAQAAASAEPASPAPAMVVASAPPAVAAPAPLPAVPLPAAEAAQPPPAEDSATDEEPAPVPPVAHSAWSTINGKSDHAKHGRVASGKTTIRRTTTVKHHVAAKRSARHH